MNLLRAVLCVTCVCSFSMGAIAGDEAQNDGITRITIHKPYRPQNSVSNDVGSSRYRFDGEALDALPQGDATPLDEVLLRAPGVVQDAYGQVHIRGDHADLQYRINGIILPEGITGFGQVLDTHFAEKIDLLTGALPAQYGYRTAGVVDITTKTGFETGGRSSITAGSQATLEGNQEFFGSSGAASYYFTGNYLKNDRGLEPPTADLHPIHDRTVQDKEFGYLSYALSPQHRLSFLIGNATNRFEIPNNPDQPQSFTLSGVPNFSSSDLDERQFERNSYAIAALQGAANPDSDYQLAFFTRRSEVLFKPDAVGDLIFNGVAARVERESLTGGVQGDVSYRLNDRHILRAGGTASYEQTKSDSDSLVFPGFFDTGTGEIVQTGTVPFSIADTSRLEAKLFGLYLQDEWRPAEQWTVNTGARFDIYDAAVSAMQLSPRLGVVYDLTPSTKLHAGYARYFTPPPTELIAPVSLQKFASTTGATPNTEDSPVVPQRDDYFDAGILQKAGTHLTLGLDAYYKKSRHVLDEGQFGQALIFAPFNYEKGWVRGIELTGDYRKGDFTAYANLAFSKAMGKGLESGQYNFGADEQDYIASHAVHLDHDQLISGSVGSSYACNGVKYSADMIFGSGLRNGFANTGHLPFYAQVNLGAQYSFDLGQPYGLLEGRLSVVNIFDRIYQIRDGSGIGVFAPQFGPRRGVFLMLSKPF